MDNIIDLLMLLIIEEERSKRSEHLQYLRDSSNPFEVDDTIFRQFFRLPKLLVQQLIEELLMEPHYFNENSTIPFAFRVLSTLHFLGHGSYQKSIASNYLIPMSQPTVSRNIACVCKLITTKLTQRIQFCIDQDAKNLIKEGSSFYTKFAIKGVIGAIDCTHVGITAPSIYDPDRPARLYMNRKGYHSINVEAIVDANLKFISVNAKFPGSVHDSAIWSTTPARINLMQQHDSRKYNWLIGDSGYPLEPWLLTPYSQPATQCEEKFNKLHIKARNTVERAFGVVKSRFRCMHKSRTLHYSPEKAGLIIYACIILHNMLIDIGYNVEMDEDVEYDEGEMNPNGLDSNYLAEGRRIRNEYAQML